LSGSTSALSFSTAQSIPPLLDEDEMPEDTAGWGDDDDDLMMPDVHQDMELSKPQETLASQQARMAKKAEQIACAHQDRKKSQDEAKRNNVQVPQTYFPPTHNNDDEGDESPKNKGMTWDDSALNF